MAIIDVRSERNVKIDKIVFADKYDQAGALLAHIIEPVNDYLLISDSSSTVFINSKQHALDFIAALEKAIELGWVE